MSAPSPPATPGSTRLQAMAHRRLRIGEHVLDIGSLRLLDAPESQRLTPKAAAVLIELATRAGQTVGRNELLDAVWAGTCPTPDVLTQAITDLRRVLGDESQAPRYIETVPKLGYRLVAEVAFLDALEAPMRADPSGVAPAP
ncbi:MAG: winged helix-turn-helix domain-containing protein, partial [Xanthomonadales bacterium]|nr:winged helix-turn-helix domain-containing protein [Xanthomonadales bacterium]